LPRFISHPTFRPIAATSLPPTAMTEYDYSASAYERYLATKARVSDWVGEVKNHQLGNPFQPSPTPTKQPPGGRVSRQSAKGPNKSRSSTVSAPSSSTKPANPTRKPAVRSHTTGDIRRRQPPQLQRSGTHPLAPHRAPMSAPSTPSDKRRHAHHNRHRSPPENHMYTEGRDDKGNRDYDDHSATW